VVATNIAETSITIPDVVVVVDSGRQKEQRYDAKRGMASLVEAWVSQVSRPQSRLLQSSANVSLLLLR
jgi:HrpA-like RNA helicase